MAKILIIGGSGRTGLHLLEQAAQRGHTTDDAAVGVCNLDGECS
jgi:nucleoside-diphosphate-sugar epimerase